MSADTPFDQPKPINELNHLSPESLSADQKDLMLGYRYLFYAFKDAYKKRREDVGHYQQVDALFISLTPRIFNALGLKENVEKNVCLEIARKSDQVWEAESIVYKQAREALTLRDIREAHDLLDDSDEVLVAKGAALTVAIPLGKAFLEDPHIRGYQMLVEMVRQDSEMFQAFRIAFKPESAMRDALREIVGQESQAEEIPETLVERVQQLKGDSATLAVSFDEFNYYLQEQARFAVGNSRKTLLVLTSITNKDGVAAITGKAIIGNKARMPREAVALRGKILDFRAQFIPDKQGNAKRNRLEITSGDIVFGRVMPVFFYEKIRRFWNDLRTTYQKNFSILVAGAGFKVKDFNIEDDLQRFTLSLVRKKSFPS